MRTIPILVLMAAAVVLPGCAGPSAQSLPSDRALCAQARIERMRGDPAWTATLERISNLYEAWYCRNYLMIWDEGGNPGGG